MATSRAKPTIQVPPRGSVGFLYANGSGPGFSPGPMTLVSSFFPEHSPFSFSQLLAGAMASPLSDGGVGRKWDKPVNLVVPPPQLQPQLQVENMSPLFMVPPGLSPSGLLSPLPVSSKFRGIQLLLLRLVYISFGFILYDFLGDVDMFVFDYAFSLTWNSCRINYTTSKYCHYPNKLESSHMYSRSASSLLGRRE